MNTTIGIGVLTMPYVFKLWSIIPAIFILFFCMALSFSTVYFLWESRNLCKKSEEKNNIMTKKYSYREIAYQLYKNDWIVFICDFILASDLLLTMLAFLVVFKYIIVCIVCESLSLGLIFNIFTYG